ncbi:MAG: sugar transporter [Sulfitobacter sp.]
MPQSDNRQAKPTAEQQGATQDEAQGQATEIRAVKEADLPEGKAAAVPSPAPVFHHRASPSLPGAQRGAEASTAAAPEVKPAENAAKPAGARPVPGVERASKDDLAHLSREELRAFRKEERRIQRVIEGRAPVQPGDPVPGAPKTLKERKQTRGRKDDYSDIRVAPVAPMAKMRKRHFGILASLMLIVILPLIVVGWYLAVRAVDQYASTVGFTVRSEDGTSLGLSTMLAAIGGGSTQTDTDILYEFMQSQVLVDNIQDRFDLRAHYSVPHDQDPFYTLPPDASPEDLLSYWSRIVTVSYDQASKLIELQVRAFSPEVAQAIATAILEDSQELINELNSQARADTLRYAEQDLEEARQRLRNSREALIRFRTRTQIVDPETDLQGRLGVVNSLQQKLADAYIEQDLLRGQTSTSDPRYVQVRRTIDVIRARISEERASVASGDVSSLGEEAYPELLAEYEGLQADRQFAEETYRAALVSYDVSNANASRQSRYLATYIQPTLPRTAEYPKRWTTFGLAALFMMLAWSIAVLIYYSIRDSK